MNTVDNTNVGFTDVVVVVKVVPVLAEGKFPFSDSPEVLQSCRVATGRGGTVNETVQLSVSVGCKPAVAQNCMYVKVAVPVECRGTECAHEIFEQSHVDLDADVTHTLMLYNIYTGPTCGVSVVGKYASREKLTISNLEESDEVTKSVDEYYAESADVMMTSYTFSHCGTTVCVTVGDPGKSNSVMSNPGSHKFHDFENYPPSCNCVGGVTSETGAHFAMSVCSPTASQFADATLTRNVREMGADAMSGTATCNVETQTVITMTLSYLKQFKCVTSSPEDRHTETTNHL